MLRICFQKVKEKSVVSSSCVHLKWMSSIFCYQNIQPKELAVMGRKKVIDGVALVFLYEVRKVESCFCFEFDKEWYALEDVRKETL